MNYKSTYKDLSDAELAETLSNWMGDALNSWNRFSAGKKSFFRKLQDEACKRFIEQNTKDADIEPTPKNDLGVDCISREQALVAIRNLYPGMPRVDFNGSLRKWADKYKPYIECDNAIKALPSVTSHEPKTGHWIDCDNSDDYSADGYDCSVCGVNAEYATSYCPNCGADMREVEDGKRTDM